MKVVLTAYICSLYEDLVIYNHLKHSYCVHLQALTGTVSRNFLLFLLNEIACIKNKIIFSGLANSNHIVSKLSCRYSWNVDWTRMILTELLVSLVHPELVVNWLGLLSN